MRLLGVIKTNDPFLRTRLGFFYTCPDMGRASGNERDMKIVRFSAAR
jgi:hypothetical protein